MLVFGQQLYGKVDLVPGLFHVATRFFYLQWIPLIPLGSMLVLDKKLTGQDNVAVKIGFSLKSLLTAWFRGILLLCLVVCVLTMLVEADGPNNARGRRNPAGNDRKGMITLGAAAAACIGLWWGSHYLTRASYKRASELAAIAGVAQEVIDERFAAHQRAPRDEAPPVTLASSKPAAPTHDDDVFRLE